MTVEVSTKEERFLNIEKVPNALTHLFVVSSTLPVILTRESKFSFPGFGSFSTSHTTYVGDFISGVTTGIGTLKVFWDAEQTLLQSKYSGCFKNGKQNGFGTCFSYIQNGKCSDIFSGEWKRGYHNGMGIIHKISFK